MRKRLWIIAPSLTALALVHCTPDFDALNRGSSSGGDASGGAGDGSGGESTAGGGSTGKGGTSAKGGSGGRGGNATTEGGAPQEGGSGGGLDAGIPGSEGGSAGAAGSSSGGIVGTGGTSTGGTTPTAGAGAGGEGGGEQGCTWDPGSTVYDGFDTKGLTGPGIVAPSSEVYVSTANAATASESWNATEGVTCPGAFQLTANFKGYSTTVPEALSAMINFQSSNWSGGIVLHAWVKVVDPGPQLQGVQVFVKSHSYQGYRSKFDAATFRDGLWHDLTVSLDPSDTASPEGFDPLDVNQFGVQVLLGPTPNGGPAVPPTTIMYLDDVWVEF